jgi:hypothetical protein
VWAVEEATGETVHHFRLANYDYPLALAFDGIRLWYINAMDSSLRWVVVPK